MGEEQWFGYYYQYCMKKLGLTTFNDTEEIKN